MYKKVKLAKTSIKVNEAHEGETIEQKVRRITEQNESITDGAPTIFTDRADGVRPEHNIRTDRWELAVDAMDKVTQNQLAKREGAAAAAKEEPQAKEKGKKTPKPKADGGSPQSGDQTATGPATTE